MFYLGKGLSIFERRRFQHRKFAQIARAIALHLEFSDIDAGDGRFEVVIGNIECLLAQKAGYQDQVLASPMLKQELLPWLAWPPALSSCEGSPQPLLPA